MLEVLELALVDGRTLTQFVPLAAQLDSLASVAGAYDLSCVGRAELSTGRDSEEAIQAAELLERAVLDVRPLTKADFLINAGVNGVVSGTLRGAVSYLDSGVSMRFGFEGEPTDLAGVRPVLDALRTHSDLVTVRYESGHAVTSEGVFKAAVGSAPFPNWVWAPFAAYSIKQEKPKGSDPQDIHDGVGGGADRSLFRWVLDTMGSDAFLTCDDGPGEVADFVRLGYDESITLIHVKAASTDSPLRSIAAAPYEVVVSQATKNLVYLDTERLYGRLQAPTVKMPATWDDGRRVADRSEMLEYLGVRASAAAARVVIVQPQLHKSAYESALAGQTKGVLGLRVRLVDTMLNAARSAVTGLGADLHVYGCDTQ